MDTDQTVIRIDDLKKIVSDLLDHLIDVEGDAVRIERDYFWSISKDERTHVYERPRDFTIGQISECWSNLETMTNDPSRELTFGLVWLAEIFRSLGEEIIV